METNSGRENYYVVSRENIDKQKWDDLVESSADGSIYCTYNYLSWCEGDWEALIEMKNGEYQSAVPIPFRTRARIRYIYQSPQIPFIAILSRGGCTKVFHQAWIRHITSYRYVAKYYVLGDVDSSLKKSDYYAQFISLNHEYEMIREQYSRYRKIRLRKAMRLNQIINQSDDLHEFISYHRQYTLPKIDGVGADQASVIEKLWTRLHSDKQLEIYSCHEEGKLIAAFLLGKFGNKLHYLASVSIPVGRKKNTQTLIIDHIIQKYAESHFEYFEMGGLCQKESMNPFKPSFGVALCQVSQLTRNDLPVALKLAKSLLNTLKIGVGQSVFASS
ncbi:hypothetical protein WSM22_44820 [Cytophagales bacterium WSM2-2]|nr:hypothetical protein WSM22_44820 [Cytophagales bacterium WSM2-2]